MTPVTHRPEPLRVRLRERVLAGVSVSSLRLEAAAANALLRDGALLVDVRRYDDPAGPLRGSTRIPPDDIPARLAELPRDRAIVLACT